MKQLAILAGLWGSPWLIAEPPAIGTVTSGGSFRLNGDTVIANGTLTDGSILETFRAGSLVRLSGGARLALAVDSRATLHSDRLVLEKGEARLENGVAFHLEALGLAIRPDRAGSTGRIGMLGAARVRVETLSGSFRVLNERGALVANVAAGSALAFEPQENSNASTRLTGVLSRQDGRFLLTDEVTHVTVELTGPGLEMYLGQRIEVIGFLDAAATPVPGASQVIRVTQSRRLSAAGRGPTSGGTGGAGTISATTIAVIGGVGVAATLGGLAANGLLPGPGGVSR